MLYVVIYFDMLYVVILTVEATISQAKTWFVFVYVEEKVVCNVTAQGVASITALVKIGISAT
jgi:hypothetical protein